MASNTGVSNCRVEFSSDRVAAGHPLTVKLYASVTADYTPTVTAVDFNFNTDLFTLTSFGLTGAPVPTYPTANDYRVIRFLNARPALGTEWVFTWVLTLKTDAEDYTENNGLDLVVLFSRAEGTHGSYIDTDGQASVDVIDPADMPAVSLSHTTAIVGNVDEYTVVATITNPGDVSDPVLPITLKAFGQNNTLIGTAADLTGSSVFQFKSVSFNAAATSGGAVSNGKGWVTFTDLPTSASPFVVTYVVRSIIDGSRADRTFYTNFSYKLETSGNTVTTSDTETITITNPPETYRATLTATALGNVVGDETLVDVTVTLDSISGTEGGSFSPNAFLNFKVHSGGLVTGSGQVVGFDSPSSVTLSKNAEATDISTAALVNVHGWWQTALYRYPTKGLPARFTFTVRPAPGIPIYYFTAELTRASASSGTWNRILLATGSFDTRTIPADTAIPVAPDGLTVTTPTTVYKTLQLTWNDVADNERSYQVRRSDDNVAFVTIATIGAGATSYEDTGLADNVTYWYKVAAVNTLGEGLSAAASGTTGIPPAAPDTAPTDFDVEVFSESELDLSWTYEDTDHTGFKIFRSTVSGGPYDEVGRTDNSARAWRDSLLNASATYYYVIYSYNGGGDSPASTEASGTTARQPANVPRICPITFPANSKTSICDVEGRVIYVSDMYRGVVFVNNRWFPLGVLPQLTGPAASAVSGGNLTGVFTAYIVLYRSDGPAWSIPIAGNTVTLSGQRLKVVPDLNAGGTLVEVRDIGYDANGTEIPGADKWQIYVAESRQENAVLLAELPITTLEYTCDASLTIDSLFDGTRRPMEQGLESLVPPAVSSIEYIENTSRVHYFGEVTRRPTADEILAGASLTIVSGGTTCTVANFAADHSLMHKELWINNKPTDCIVIDVLSATSIKLLKYDSALKAVGYDGASGTFNDFSFVCRRGRVYRSGHYAGEATGIATTFNPEGVPPFNVLDQQLNTDDNEDPAGIVASRDVAFLFKNSSIIRLSGGGGVDGSVDANPDVVVVSRGTGCANARTIARDRNDNVYFCSDTGPFRIPYSSVENVGEQSGNSLLFSKVFDTTSLSDAVAAWFSRKDYYICAGLNRIGNTSRLDGFSYDSRTNRILPFDTIRQITALCELKADDGQFMMLAGDEAGFLMSAYDPGIAVDDANYTNVDRYADAQGVDCYSISGVINSVSGRLSVRDCRPIMRYTPEDLDIDVTVEIDDLSRSDDPDTFAAATGVTVSTADTPNKVTFAGNSQQSARVKMSFSTSTDGPEAFIKFGDMPLTIVERRASAE